MRPETIAHTWHQGHESCARCQYSGICSRASPQGIPAIVLKIVDESHDIVLSEDMIWKLDEVLQRPYFASNLPDPKRAGVVERLRRVSTIVNPDPSVTGVADVDEDDRVIETAVAAGADVIVTGDKGLLTFRHYQGIPIVSAREFLVIINL